MIYCFSQLLSVTALLQASFCFLPSPCRLPLLFVLLVLPSTQLIAVLLLLQQLVTLLLQAFAPSSLPSSLSVPLYLSLAWVLLPFISDQRQVFFFAHLLLSFSGFHFFLFKVSFSSSKMYMSLFIPIFFHSSKQYRFECCCQAGLLLRVQTDLFLFSSFLFNRFSFIQQCNLHKKLTYSLIFTRNLFKFVINLCNKCIKNMIKMLHIIYYLIFLITY